MAGANVNQRLMNLYEQAEKNRIEDIRRRQNAPDVAREGGMLTGEQETARIRARETESQRQEAEKLRTAISELERIARPGGLLERSTGSGIGRLVDIAGAAVGMSSRGAQAAAALAPIADVVLKMVPRFEGPQSDKDTAAYQAAAGQLADSTIPNETRLAAAREIIRLMRNRREQFSFSGNAAPAAAPAASAAPAAQTPPSLDQFLARARPANPNVSVEDLTAYYNRTYGSR
jgi:hypothetical protein